MERSHSFSRPSPTNGKPRSPSPRSTTTTKSTTMPSRGRPSESGSTSRPNSRSLSSSRSSSRSRSRRRHRHQRHQPQHEHEHEHHHEHPHHGLFKTSASLLAGIGLATVLAHKVWPKGILHGDEEEWMSRPIPKAKHHHRHHHHSSERYEHHRRRSSDADRMLDRARSTYPRGDVMYVEEEGPYRRGDARRKSLDPRTLDRIDDEMANWEAKSPRSRPAVLPYPETPYPDEKFYEPTRMRGPVPAPIPVSR